MRTGIYLGTLALTGCAEMIDERLGGALRESVGHNISEVMQDLGAPGQERVVAGQHIYTWVFAGRGRAVEMPAENLTFAFAGTPSCTLEIITDESGTIQGGHWSAQAGDIAPCAQRWPEKATGKAETL